MNATISSSLTRTEIAARLRERLCASGEDVIGIILFGSFARGEAWHDVDVLVVIETLPSSQTACNRQLAALKRVVGWPPVVDLLLYSQKDFQLNLANHTPLFLDIAFDGHVIYDKGGIQQALEKTRADVLAQGIQRTLSGWRFPVRRHVPTPLSPRSNEEWAET